MEITIVCRGYIGIMEKKMDTTILGLGFKGYGFKGFRVQGLGFEV